LCHFGIFIRKRKAKVIIFAVLNLFIYEGEAENSSRAAKPTAPYFKFRHPALFIKRRNSEKQK